MQGGQQRRKKKVNYEPKSCLFLVNTGGRSQQVQLARTRYAVATTNHMSGRQYCLQLEANNLFWEVLLTTTVIYTHTNLPTFCLVSTSN